MSPAVDAPPHADPRLPELGWRRGPRPAVDPRPGRWTDHRRRTATSVGAGDPSPRPRLRHDPRRNRRIRAGGEGQAIRRRHLANQPRLPADQPELHRLGIGADSAGRLLRGGRRGLAGRGARPLRAHRADQRHGAHQHPAGQPGGPQARHRHRRAQRRPRHGKAARGPPAQRRDAHPDRPVRLRRRPQPRNQQGRGRLPGRRHRGASSTRRRRRRSGSGRWSSCRRPSAGSTSWTCGRVAASSSTPSARVCRSS